MTSKSDLLADLLLLSHTARRVLQDEVVAELKEKEINVSRINILRLIARRGAQTVNNLAMFLDLSKAAASQNIDVLARRELVTRRDDTEDRRTTWVEITRPGMALLETVERRQRERTRKVLDSLPPGIQREAGRVLRELAVSLMGISGASDMACLQCCAFRSGGCIKEAEGWSCCFMELGRTPTPLAPA